MVQQNKSDNIDPLYLPDTPTSPVCQSVPPNPTPRRSSRPRRPVERYGHGLWYHKPERGDVWWLWTLNSFLINTSVSLLCNHMYIYILCARSYCSVCTVIRSVVHETCAHLVTTPHPWTPHRLQQCNTSVICISNIVIITDLICICTWWPQRAHALLINSPSFPGAEEGEEKEVYYSKEWLRCACKNQCLFICGLNACIYNIMHLQHEIYINWRLEAWSIATIAWSCSKGREWYTGQQFTWQGKEQCLMYLNLAVNRLPSLPL